jgi:hypothetical protein
MNSSFLTRKGRYFAVMARPTFPSHYDNFINGKFVPPVDGKYFDNVSPIGMSIISF